MGSQLSPPAPLGPGDRAPDFELPQGLDRVVRLSDQVRGGPVLLLFYVFDFGHY